MCLLILFAIDRAQSRKQGHLGLYLRIESRPAFAPGIRQTNSECGPREPAEVIFEDCHVPDENRLGDDGGAL